jgi:acyl-CoA synthetase (AMP-forming)/AMP-acid ligase II
MQANTILDVMNAYAQDSSCESALHCWNGSDRSYFPVSYCDLSQRAFAFGSALFGRMGSNAIPSKTAVMIACHTPYATLVAFYAAISIGAIPMIFPMPLSLGSHRALSERIKHWGLFFEEPAMLVLEEGLNEKFHADIPQEIEVLRISDDPTGQWQSSPQSANGYQPNELDVAFFQTTSSSTGDHKAVAISHQNILANVYGIKRAQNMSDDERMTTWLPLFHDMGLVGTVLFSFGNNYPLYIMTPTQFVKRPAVWMKGLAEHKCTIATAPNFGFDYCSRLVSDKDAQQMDLNHVKHLFIGAEPIRVSTVAAFLKKFKVSGISPKTIRPAYGLAESTIIASMTSPNKTSQFICFDPDSVGMNQRVKVLDTLVFDEAVLSAHDPAQSMAVCAGGSAIDGVQITIVDESGNQVAGEGIAGEIALQGTSVAMGYVAGGDQLIDRFENAYVRTGDLGTIIEGELYILERLKNIVIRNGENYLVSALEEQLAELFAISHEHVAVFDSDIHDPDSDIVVLVERHAPISQVEIDALLVAMPKEAFPINRVLLSRSREIPRTTSGKKRHFYCRKMYQKQEINYQQSFAVSPALIMQAMNAAQAKLKSS